jgi:hypothetical protein
MKAVYVLAIAALLTAACDPDLTTHVKTTAGNPPTFVVSGVGNFGGLNIYEPGYRGDLLDKSHMIWAIAVEGAGEEGKPFTDVGAITYGVTPQGYKQLIPASGLAPVALSEGDRYRYYIPGSISSPAEGYFEIRNNKAEIVERIH